MLRSRSVRQLVWGTGVVARGFSSYVQGDSRSSKPASAWTKADGGPGGDRWADRVRPRTVYYTKSPGPFDHRLRGRASDASLHSQEPAATDHGTARRGPRSGGPVRAAPGATSGRHRAAGWGPKREDGGLRPGGDGRRDPAERRSSGIRRALLLGGGRAVRAGGSERRHPGGRRAGPPGPSMSTRRPRASSTRHGSGSRAASRCTRR